MKKFLFIIIILLIFLLLTASKNKSTSWDGLFYSLYLEDGSRTWHNIREVPTPSNNYTFTKMPSGTYNIEVYSTIAFIEVQLLMSI